ncbi:transporter [Marinomonas sp. CT5]|uniref:tripartite tricarboxylate transporter substrate binding protein n=1 Tax=Marinomonas sp. CT5 TaxID=2066133 RepID=UPI001BAF601C|nr:tripartite tricarboxylate transporter substrate binding protein [Marinomonas sp. CT5]QUX97463.1 transporter [Marinomonas sp. CT5]
MNKLTSIIGCSLLAALIVLPQVAKAEYPQAPVTFVVPFPPGDLEDVLTKIIAEEMTKETGHSATVKNIAGNSGIVGGVEVWNAPADGSVIGSFVNDLVTMNVLTKSVPWDENGFEPLGIFLDYPFVIAVSSKAPYNTLKELATYSQSNSVTLGHFGRQALPTAMTFQAADRLGIKFSSDSGFDATDCSILESGQVDVINTTTQLVMDCLQSGDIKILASFTSSRISLSPNSQTMDEAAGIPISIWNGLFVRAGTPDEVKQRITEIAKKALRSDEVKKIANETGAGIYWQDAGSAKMRIQEELFLSQQLLKYLQ